MKNCVFVQRRTFFVARYLNLNSPDANSVKRLFLCESRCFFSLALTVHISMCILTSSCLRLRPRCRTYLQTFFSPSFTSSSCQTSWILHFTTRISTTLPLPHFQSPLTSSRPLLLRRTLSSRLRNSNTLNAILLKVIVSLKARVSFLQV